MPVNTETKLLVGILAITVLIVVGGALLAGRQTGGRVDVSDARLVRPNNPASGATDAKVTIVEFSDFECPVCAAVQPMLRQLKEEYKDKPVQFVFKHFPLNYHQQSQMAAEATLAAHAQGKFWEYHDLLFENQQQLLKEDLLKYAEQVGLDVERLAQALGQGEFKEAVKQDKIDGQGLGVNGTPTFFINGAKYNGELSVDGFRKVIDAEL